MRTISCGRSTVTKAPESARRYFGLRASVVGGIQQKLRALPRQGDFSSVPPVVFPDRHTKVNLANVKVAEVVNITKGGKL
jgi:hypothetical protein